MRDTGKMTLIEQYGLPPNEIEERSFHIIKGLLPDLDGTPAERLIKVRMIHAAGDPGILPELHIAPGAVASGIQALKSGASIFTDVRMIAVGISPGHCQKLGTEIESMYDRPDVAAKARAEGTTRAVAAVRLYGERLDGQIVAIGNAPTALLALIDLVDAGVCRPALIIGTPVGFVNAAEAKDELKQRDLPYITLTGWRGGSAVAVAAANAILRLATGAHTYIW